MRLINTDAIPLSDFNGYWLKAWTGDGHWFRVLLYVTKEEFVEAAKRAGVTGPLEGKNGAAALTSWMKRRNKYKSRLKNKRQLGQILFCLETITGDLIAHECFHAAMIWWRQVAAAHGRRRFSREQEEQIAVVVQLLFHQISGAHKAVAEDLRNERQPKDSSSRKDQS